MLKLGGRFSLTNSFKKQLIRAVSNVQAIRENSSASSNTAASNEEPPTIGLDQKCVTIFLNDFIIFLGDLLMILIYFLFRLQALLSKDLVVPVFKKALLYDNKIALKDQHGEFSYGQLFSGAKKLSIQVSNLCGSASLSRVAFLCPNDQNNIITQWAIWMSGQIAVPLSSNHPSELWEYFLSDSQATLLITTPEFETKLKPLAEKLNKPLIVIEHENFVAKEVSKDFSILDKKLEHVLEIDNKLIIDGVQSGEFYKKSPAMILYTSGTTNKPKGVVMTYR